MGKLFLGLALLTAFWNMPAEALAQAEGSPPEEEAVGEAEHPADQEAAIEQDAAEEATPEAEALRLECEFCEPETSGADVPVATRSGPEQPETDTETADESAAEVSAQGDDAGELVVPDPVSTGSRYAVLTEAELLQRERDALLLERVDTEGSGGRMFAGGLIGLVGLAGAIGVIAGRDVLIREREVIQPDGSVRDETSATGFGLLLAGAGILAATGLVVFLGGVSRRHRRQEIDERLRELDQENALTPAATQIW